MNNVKIDPQFAIAVAGLAVTAMVVVLFLKRQAKEAITGASNIVGGAVSGNNAITRGTVYQGGGVAGTLGAAANSASGGLFESVGSWLGGKVYDLTHPHEGLPQSFIATDVDARTVARLKSEAIAP